MEKILIYFLIGITIIIILLTIFSIAVLHLGVLLGLGYVWVELGSSVE